MNDAEDASRAAASNGQDSQEGPEGRESGQPGARPAGADSREVGPDDGPTVSRATASLQETPVAQRGGGAGG